MIHEFSSVILIENVKISLLAEVGNKHETMCVIHINDFRGIETGFASQQAVDLDESAEALGRFASAFMAMKLRPSAAAMR